MAVQAGKIYEAAIESYSSQGVGVARVEGMAIFVREAIRGERAEILVEHVGRHAAWARIHRLLCPSPARIQPDCPYYGRCGGCQLRHMDYQEELQLKRLRVQDALARLGGIPLPVEIIHGAANPQRYRNKVQFPVAPGSIGYFQSGTHRVVDIRDCLLQPQVDTACLCAVRRWMETYRVPAYREREGTGLVRHLYLRSNRAGQVLCCLVLNGNDLPHSRELVDALRQAAPRLVGVVVNCNTRRTNVILGPGYRTLWGQPWLEETLCGHHFRLSVPSFFQINAPQTEILYQRVVDFASLTGTETVIDLYCGIGTISLTLAARAKQVIGVEVVPQAVEDARANAQRNALAGKTRFEVGDASRLAVRLALEGVRPDVVVVDPPRKGLAADVVEAIARMSPHRVVYVSCDPATLARDAGRFASLGYQAVRVEAVDLFPRTAHVETVVLLSKLNTKQHIEVELNLDELDLTSAESKATYEEIKAYVLEKFGLKVSSLYISQVKRKCGLDVGQNYNLPKKENAKVPQCPPEKEAAIMEALKHFQMLE